MSKEYRFLPRIVAGVLAVGAAVGIASHERGSQETKVEKPEKPEKAVEQIELGPESDPKFCAEHPIEAELRRHKVDTDKMRAALDEASESIRAHRYGDAKNEEEYFGACRDVKRWQGIENSIKYAAEKTGVPESVLTAMGFIESQFDESAERSDTKVYGPYQMTLETAKLAAKDARECFGFPIEVKTVKDLRDTKKAVQLAALHLRAKQKQYGDRQLGLAIIDFAGGHVEKRIHDADPKIDLGEKDWKDMERHHLAEGQFQKQRDELLKRIKQGRASDQDRKTLRHVVGQFEAAGIAYKKAKSSWAEKRQKLPKALEDAGITALSLYERAKAKGEKLPDAMIYPFALDQISADAQKHVKEARAEKPKVVVDQTKQ